MRVTGIDITSSPRPGKPIMSTSGILRGGHLRVDRLERLTSLESFAEHLRRRAREGPAVLGLDCPLSLPARFLDGLPELRGKSWREMMRELASRSSQDVEKLMEREKLLRGPTGRQLTRAADQLAGAASPLRVRNEPFTGKMFARIVPLLWRLVDEKRISVPLLAENPAAPVRVVEVYPGLVARSLLAPGARYKNSREPVIAENRAVMLKRLRGGFLRSQYGVRLEVPEQMAQAGIQDAAGDVLDALMATLQSAWFAKATPRIEGHEVRREGWIMDPLMGLS
jgi:hypothetical protein